MADSALSKVSQLGLWIFVFCLMLSASYAVFIQGRFTIDTGLADVAPDIVKSEHAKDAIKSLRTNIEKRMLLLVSGVDQDAVFDAADALSESLANSPELRVLPNSEELVENLIRTLERYRFNFLGQQQADFLVKTSKEQIAESAVRALHSMASARVYPFNKDPFGIHSASLFELLQNLQSVEKENQELIRQTIGLSIVGNALSMNEQSVLIHELESNINRVISEFDVEIDQSGVFFFAVHAAQESKRDISFISGISSVGVVLLLLLVFRSISALLLPVVSVLVGVAFAFIATHFVYGNVHVLTIVFGASLIGIVIDYSLHYFYHSSNADAKSDSIEREALHRALLLSLCTSLIGYAALSFSGLDALKKVAFFSCCGLFMAWLSVICFGQFAVRNGIKSDPFLLRAAVNGLLGLVKPLAKVGGLIVISVLVMAALVLLFVKPFSDDPRVFFTAPQALIESERKVAAVANDYEPGRYVLLLGASVEQVQLRFEQAQSVISTKTKLPSSALSSVFSLVPSKKQQLEAYRLQKKLYGHDGAIELLAREVDLSSIVVDSIIKEYENSDDEYLTPAMVQEVLGESLPPMWFENASGYVGFVLIRKGINADTLADALSGIEGVEYVNTLTKTQFALAEQRQSAMNLLILAYVLVAGVLIARFRSFKAAYMVGVPLASSAMLLLLAVPFSYELNLFHVMALFLVLGFGMDYTIFVREMGEHQAKTLQAILLSALTSLLSFGLLSLSNIPVVASFGTALLIGNGFNLLGAFLYSQLTVRNA